MDKLQTERRGICVRAAEQYFVDRESDLEENESEVDSLDQSSEFALENHLRDYLVRGNNLNKIEAGLKIFSVGDRSGVEFSIDDRKGRIDILATDTSGKFVVIELKLKAGSRRVIGQLLYYMGWVERNMANDAKPCRGIIVASDVKDELRLAVSQVPNVKIARYNVDFSIEYC